MKTTTKRPYEKPTCRVFDLTTAPRLLAGSDPNYFNETGDSNQF